MAAPRKPKVEMYWTTEKKSKEEMAAERARDKATLKRTGKEYPPPSPTRQVINWRLIGANGELMCQCTQGFTSRQDAKDSIDRCGHLLYQVDLSCGEAKLVGPGRKPS